MLLFSFFLYLFLSGMKDKAAAPASSCARGPECPGGGLGLPVGDVLHQARLYRRFCTGSTVHPSRLQPKQIRANSGSCASAAMCCLLLAPDRQKRFPKTNESAKTRYHPHKHCKGFVQAAPQHDPYTQQQLSLLSCSQRRTDSRPLRVPARPALCGLKQQLQNNEAPSENSEIPRIRTLIHPQPVSSFKKAKARASSVCPYAAYRRLAPLVRFWAALLVHAVTTKHKHK